MMIQNILIFGCKCIKRLLGLGGYHAVILFATALILGCGGNDGDTSVIAAPVGEATLAIRWHSQAPVPAVRSLSTQSSSGIGIVQTQSIDDLPSPGEEMYTTLAINDCSQEGIETISCSVYGEDFTLLTESGTWRCDARGGEMDGIPAGNDRIFVCMGSNSAGDLIYQGQRSGITITADKLNDVGTVEAYAFTPRPVSPAQGAGVSVTEVTLSWEAVTNASQYRLQVAEDIGFSRLSADLRTAQTSHNLTDLLADTAYYWRVTAIDAYGHMGAAGSIREFVTSGDEQVDDEPVDEVDSVSIAGNWTHSVTAYYQYYSDACGFGELFANGVIIFTASNGQITELSESGTWFDIDAGSCENGQHEYSNYVDDMSPYNLSEPVPFYNRDAFCDQFFNLGVEAPRTITVEEFTSERIVCRYDWNIPSTSEIPIYIIAELTR